MDKRNDGLDTSVDAKMALQKFNNDFQNRCMQEDILEYHHQQMIDWIKERSKENLDIDQIAKSPYFLKEGPHNMNVEEDNEDILKMIRDQVIQFGMAHRYDFSFNAENYKKSIDDMFRIYSNDPTITKEINHTGFPDDIVIMMIALNTGYRVLSIRDFESVDAKWHNDEYKVGYIFSVKFKCSTISVDINLDNINKGGC